MSTEIRNQNPAIKFLNMNKSLFKAFLKIVELPPDARYTLGALRSYQTIYDPEGNEKVFKNYLRTIKSIYNAGVANDKNGKRSFKHAIKQAKDTFISDLKRIQLNAKFATTILSIMQTHQEFKTSINPNKPYPWTNWNTGKDLIDYCRIKNLAIERCYTHDPAIIEKIRKPKTFHANIQLLSKETEEIKHRLLILFKDIINECNQPDKQQREEDDHEEQQEDENEEENQTITINTGRIGSQAKIRSRQDKNDDDNEQEKEKSKEKNILKVEICNSKSMISHHTFILDDIMRQKPYGIHSIQSKDTINIKLVIIDPPFGILAEPWDQRWSYDDFRSLLINIKKIIPNTPIVIFYSTLMLPDILKIVAVLNYKFEFLYWHMLGKHKTPNASINYDISPIIILYQSDPLPRVWSNYFPCATDKFASHRSLAINVTQKPIKLLKFIISTFINSNDKRKTTNKSIVLDLCCGSGSTAVAAASLGVCSISFDKRKSQVFASYGRLRKIAWSTIDKISEATSNDQSTDSSSSNTAIQLVLPDTRLQEETPVIAGTLPPHSPEINPSSPPPPLEITIDLSEEHAEAEENTNTDSDLVLSAGIVAKPVLIAENPITTDPVDSAENKNISPTTEIKEKESPSDVQ
jgi:hypothetical protein